MNEQSVVHVVRSVAMLLVERGHEKHQNKSLKSEKSSLIPGDPVTIWSLKSGNT